MKFDLSRIYSKVFWAGARREVFNAFASPPAKYWPKFLLAISFLFLSALALNLYLFLSLERGRAQVPAEAIETSGPRINLSGLASAVKIIKDREAEFQKAVSLPVSGDPSL